MPMLAQHNQNSTAQQATTCFHGNTFCIEGKVEHGACQGPLATVYVPGFNGPVPTLDAQILDCGEGPILSFSGNAYDGRDLTPAQLRAVVADVHNHLDRLLQLADQYEALAVVR